MLAYANNVDSKRTRPGSSGSGSTPVIRDQGWATIRVGFFGGGSDQRLPGFRSSLASRRDADDYRRRRYLPSRPDPPPDRLAQALAAVAANANGVFDLSIAEYSATPPRHMLGLLARAGFEALGFRGRPRRSLNFAAIPHQLVLPPLSTRTPRVPRHRLFPAEGATCLCWPGLAAGFQAYARSSCPLVAPRAALLPGWRCDHPLARYVALPSQA